MTDFMNPWGLYAFLVLVPIIILYLLRPKPKDLHVPSLMFIIEAEQRRRFNSIFKRILKDPLLILQIATISLLVLAISDPFYSSKETKITKQDVAIVIDLSASMQAESRFSQAMDKASSVIADLDNGDTVSIVLAENLPVVALRKGTPSKAKEVLQKLTPKATPTSLGGAIALASDLIKDSKAEKAIYVISDFSWSRGVDPLAAQKSAFSKGISVEFIGVGGGVDNIGIIGSRSGRESGSCFMEVLIRNYGASEKNVALDFLLNGQIVDTNSDLIGADSTGVFRLSAACHDSQYEAVAAIRQQDGLSVDNKAYAIIPKAIDLDVLLIREKNSNKHIKYVLESLEGVSVSEAFPPIYPQDYSGYDTVIFQDAGAKNILKGTFAEIKQYVEQGGSLVVMGFEGLASAPAEDISMVLPIDVLGVSNSGGEVALMFDHQILGGIDFGEIAVYNYLSSKAKEGATILAEIENNPVIAMRTLGRGEVLYFGISSDTAWSDFYLKPSFPIFWHDALYWLNRDETIGRRRNFKTGEQLPFAANQTNTLRMPSGAVMSGDALLDEAGFYDTSMGRIAASLLDEQESDVSFRIESESMKVQDSYVPARSSRDVINELFWLLALAALAAICIEWVYYKGRGSL